MEDKKTDRRVVKTRMHMIQTTLELLRKNSFSKISVSDICEEAMISRSTFYTHFEDKFALLDACMEQIGQKLLHDTESADPRSRHNAMITAIEADARLFRNIFINGKTEEVQTIFFNHCHKDLLAIIETQTNAGHQFSDPPEAIAAFYAGGISSMLNWWITNNFPVSAQEMIHCQNHLMSALFPDEL